MSDLISTKQVDTLVHQLVESTVTEQVKDYLSKVDIAVLGKNTMDQYIQLAVRKQLSTMDMSSTIRDSVERVVKQNLTDVIFPDASIPATAINFKNFTFSGGQIKDGIHEGFGSIGIDDQATDCMLSVFDDYVVVENHLLAQNATIKNSLTVEGDLVIKGDINTDSRGFQRFVNQAVERTKTDIKETMLDGLADATIEKLKVQGIEASKLTIKGKLVLDDEGLGKSIVTSNLQKVGTLVELRVRGETLLTDTLYVTSKRAGVNTLEPSRAWAVWEEECETVMGKYEKNTGYIGSVRNQKVVLGSNNNVNIVLEVDGSTKITNLKLGNIRVNSTDTMPNWAGKSGDVYFNEDPAVGKPMGWVCLGGERWAQLPKITE
jgi:hypothetical protein